MPYVYYVYSARLMWCIVLTPQKKFKASPHWWAGEQKGFSRYQQPNWSTLDHGFQVNFTCEKNTRRSPKYDNENLITIRYTEIFILFYFLAHNKGTAKNSKVPDNVGLDSGIVEVWRGRTISEAGTLLRAPREVHQLTSGEAPDCSLPVVFIEFFTCLRGDPNL
jgi:hypothetical protein